MTRRLRLRAPPCGLSTNGADLETFGPFGCGPPEADAHSAVRIPQGLLVLVIDAAAATGSARPWSDLWQGRRPHHAIPSTGRAFQKTPAEGPPGRDAGAFGWPGRGPCGRRTGARRACARRSWPSVTLPHPAAGAPSFPFWSPYIRCGIRGAVPRSGPAPPHPDRLRCTRMHPSSWDCWSAGGLC